MSENRSLGGIGRLYCDNTLLGDVYYNIKQDIPRGLIYGSIVFVGSEVELSNDERLYHLLLEDRQYLIVRLTKDPNSYYSPYTWTSSDGIMYAESSHSFA